MNYYSPMSAYGATLAPPSRATGPAIQRRALYPPVPTTVSNGTAMMVAPPLEQEPAPVLPEGSLSPPPGDDYPALPPNTEPMPPLTNGMVPSMDYAPVYEEPLYPMDEPANGAVAPPKDNTALYVGLGLLAAAAAGWFFFARKKKEQK